MEVRVGPVALLEHARTEFLHQLTSMVGVSFSAEALRLLFGLPHSDLLCATNSVNIPHGPPFENRICHAGGFEAILDPLKDAVEGLWSYSGIWRGKQLLRLPS